MGLVKFRAECLSDRSFVYGYYFSKSNGTNVHHYVVVGSSDIEVDPETVCPYIGMKDKNGEEIYESDVVRYRGEIRQVRWSSINLGFRYYPTTKEGNQIIWTPEEGYDNDPIIHDEDNGAIEIIGTLSKTPKK